ncbi:MAG: MATE family efflux transporter [Bacilli bacterium]|jgi:Na+-driven multidrug efflux pump|nr:MATE family efflux transporter [Bacilli bacterium]
MALDLAKDDIHHLYTHFLWNALGAALVASVFGVVDMAMMGHYQGPDGPAALAIISPFWNLVYSLGLLTGIGSSVLYAALKGKEDKFSDPNEYFTLGLILTSIISVLEAIFLNIYLEPLLVFFGAEEVTLPLCLKYLTWIRWGFPVFTFSNFLAAFLRNDKVPGLATAAVIAGGSFNILFDYIFIFTCNMGMEGAGLATILGMCLGDGIMCSHFFSKSNSLRLVSFHSYFKKSSLILLTGFSSFFADAAMGIVNVAFNKQILFLFPESSDSYLAIYGVLLNIYVLMQCISYGIGQAAQPLVSFNYGASLFPRVRHLLHDLLITIGVVSLLGLVLTEGLPSYILKIFMTTTPEVERLGPLVIRPFCSCFILLPFNVVICYYFQAILKEKAAFVVSVLRGAVIPLITIFSFPYLHSDLIWYAMVFTEILTGIISISLLIVYTKKLEKQSNPI